MATDNLVFLPAQEDVAKAADLPRIQMSEQGYTGLKVSAGLVYEELKRELTFPHSMVTYKQMSYDSTIAAALSYYEAMMLKARFKVVPPEDATDEEKEQAKFIKQCMDDMEHSWQDFLQEVSSMNTYGFSAHEIVLRKRLKSKGSKYNDGKIGWQKLPIRGQESIASWIFDEKSRNLLGLKQSIQTSGYNGKISVSSSGQETVIPRKKFLLFRLGKRKDSPFGESPLRNCYFSWKYKTEIEAQEAIGTTRDLGGIPHAEVPPQIMAADATEEMKAQYNQWLNIVRNLHNNQQAGLVTPLIYDPETKMPLYKFSLLKNEGGKAYDTTQIKNYYVNAILTALSADVLILGQGATGSYALGSIKGTLAAIAIEAKLREVCNVINQHLIPLTGEYNGWDSARLPRIDIEDLESTSLDEISKFVQRIGAVGYLPKTPEVFNKILDGLGISAMPEGTDFESLLPEKTTKAGQGMQEGLGSGTGSADGSAGDASSVNSDNAS